MTYFETPYAARAADLGMTEEALYAWEEALSDEWAEMTAAGFPNLALEDRPVIGERDVFDPITVWTVEAIDNMEADFYAMIGRTR